METTIVITSASGKQAASLIPHLLKARDVHLRLVVSSAASKERLSSTYPDPEITIANTTRFDDCLRITEGATSIFHIGPTFNVRETEMGLNMIDAATHHCKQNGNAIHFVYSSVLHSQLRKMLHHDAKRYVEEYLMESCLNYTILQPTTFLNNIPVAMIAKQDQPVFPAMWDPDVKFSMLALQDFGEVAAKVLLEDEKHYFAEYALTSTQPVSVRELIEEIAKHSGKDVQIEKKTLSDSTEMLCNGVSGGDDVRVKEAAERMVLYYERHGLKASPRVVEWLLGRQPTSMREFVDRELKG